MGHSPESQELIDHCTPVFDYLHEQVTSGKSQGALALVSNDHEGGTANALFVDGVTLDEAFLLYARITKDAIVQILNRADGQPHEHDLDLATFYETMKYTFAIIAKETENTKTLQRIQAELVDVDSINDM